MSASGLDVLDPRFPVRWTLLPGLFNQLADEWPDRKTARIFITNGVRRDTLTQASYVRALTEQTQPFKAITAPVRTEYDELRPERLTAEFEAMPPGATHEITELAS